jgi:hypothetical protein
MWEGYVTTPSVKSLGCTCRGAKWKNEVRYELVFVARGHQGRDVLLGARRESNDLGTLT